MPDQAVEFASLLCSRLCHDLLSPVGALGIGLEMLAEERDEGRRAECLKLVADSQAAVSAKFQMFRLAFGAGGTIGDTVGAAELRSGVEALAANHKRVELGWLVAGDGLPRLPARLLLNLVMIALDTLVRGGRLDVDAEGHEVAVRAEGPRLTLDAGVRAVLAGEHPGPPDARTAPAWLVRRLAEDANGRVQLADGEEGVLLLAAAVPG